MNIVYSSEGRVAQIKQAHMMIAWFFISSGAVLFKTYWLEYAFLDFFTYLFAVFFMVFLIPYVFIHARYYAISNGVEVVFKESLFLYSSTEFSAEYLIKDLVVVKKYVTNATYNEDLPVLPWDEFGYSVFEFKDGQKVVITSFTVPELDFPVTFSCKRELEPSFFVYPQSLKNS